MFSILSIIHILHFSDIQIAFTRFSLLLFLTAECLCLQSKLSASERPTLELSYGTVEGYFLQSLNNRTFAAFEGIPYAEPPVGNLRFEKPVTFTKKWVGTWKANTLYKCIQNYHYTEPGQDFVIGEEDCLYLNVYTPNLYPSKPMHVIIFIHGGAFMFNNGGTYGPKILMDNDVVYVSLNYRLGPLGFLSTEDEVVPGNNGLRDQIVALEWIKDNIRQFGGNADSITLAGMSAGGASVHFHTMSPLTRDKTLIQSGTALNNWVLVEHSRAKATRLGSIVGCDMTNIAHMVGCMKTKPAKQIVAASKQFQPYMYNPFSPFGVVVDSWATNPVLPVHPYLYLLSKEIQHVPVIFSHVQAEGLYPAAGSLEEINEQWNELIPFILDFNNTIPASQRDKTSQAIRKHYFGDSPVNRDSIDRLVQMVTDRLFVADIQKAAVMHAKASQQPVYYYNYYYRAAYSKSNYRSKSLENFGTSHGDDTICVLSSNVNCHSNKQDRRMSRVLQDIWVNFNKNRNQQFRDVEWIPLRNNAERPDVLRINSPDDIHMEANADLGNNQFWQNQMFSENERIIGSEKVEL